MYLAYVEGHVEVLEYLSSKGAIELEPELLGGGEEYYRMTSIIFFETAGMKKRDYNVVKFIVYSLRCDGTFLNRRAVTCYLIT